MYMMYMSGIGSGSGNLLGIGLILLSTLSQSLYQVFARKLTQGYSLFTITYSLTLIGFVVFNGLSITNHFIHGTIREFFQPFGHVDFVMAILYLGILSTFVNIFSINLCLIHFTSFSNECFWSFNDNCNHFSWNCNP